MHHVAEDEEANILTTTNNTSITTNKTTTTTTRECKMRTASTHVVVVAEAEVEDEASHSSNIKTKINNTSRSMSECRPNQRQSSS